MINTLRTEFPSLSHEHTGQVQTVLFLYLPQAQEENESHDQSSHRDTVAEVVDDQGYLVVYRIFSL